MINIHFTGHNIELTPALKAFVQEKAEKLHRHIQPITAINVILFVEKDQQTAEATISISKFECHAKCTSTDMYHSIDDMIDKLDKQLIKHKEKTQGRRD